MSLLSHYKKIYHLNAALKGNQIEVQLLTRLLRSSDDDNDDKGGR
jgi:hypothetical protein